MNEEELLSAKAELSKLPLLGPVLWLMARDRVRRASPAGEMDWHLMPPLVLDQLQIVTRFDVPWAYCTWAFVSESVHERLSSPEARIEPHEWRSGDIPWLIEVCAPFGGADEVVRSAIQTMATHRPVHAWMPAAEDMAAELKTFDSHVQ